MVLQLIIGIIIENIEMLEKIENMKISHKHVQVYGMGPANTPLVGSVTMPVRISYQPNKCIKTEYLVFHAIDIEQAFLETWEVLDADGSGMINATGLTTLLLEVPPPMGVKGLDRTPMRIQTVVQDTQIPLRSVEGSQSVWVLILSRHYDAGCLSVHPIPTCCLYVDENSCM